MGRRQWELGWRGIVSLLSPVAIGVVAAYAWTSAGAHVRPSFHAAMMIRPGALSGATTTGGRAVLRGGPGGFPRRAGHSGFGHPSRWRTAQADSSGVTPASSGFVTRPGKRMQHADGDTASRPARRRPASDQDGKRHPQPGVSWVGPVPPGLRAMPPMKQPRQG